MDLIGTVTVSLAFAFVGGLLANRIGLSPILGYLVAGMLLGPFTPGFVANPDLAHQLADMGLILLLFGVGIHFSPGDLRAVGGVGLAGALGTAAVLTAGAIYVTELSGWGLRAGVVLGLSLSVASTVVGIRMLMDRGEMDSLHGRIIVGWLVVEDLLTVVALVLVPVALGDSGNDNLLASVGLTLVKTATFGLLMVVVGTRSVPWLLAEVARTGSRELFTLGVLAVALGIALGAWVVFGVSLALGAFVAGVVVGQSDLSHQAAADALPLRDAFAVLFFVSVGILFDPTYLVTAPWLTVAALLVVLIVKPVLGLIFAAAFGYAARTAFIVAASRAQIGEFSFILAGLGRSVGILPEAGYHLIVSTAVFSIALTPLVARLADQLWDHPPVRAVFEWLSRGSGGALSTLPVPETGLRGHAILCGHGRVGRVIAAVMERRGFRYVVVDQDRRLVERLRRQDVRALYGDASAPSVLDHAGLEQARVLVIALADPAAVRRIVDHARRINPGLDIVARTHSETEWEHLRDGRVNEAVLGERELAIEMVRHTLQRFGVTAAETQAIAQRIRLGE